MEASIVDNLPSLEVIETELGTLRRKANVLAQIRKALLRQQKEDERIAQFRAKQKLNSSPTQSRASA